MSNWATSPELKHCTKIRSPCIAKLPANLCRTWQGLGLVHLKHGDAEQAERMFDEAIGILNRLADSHPDDVENRVELASTESKLALLYTQAKRYEDADAARQRAIDIRRRLVEQFPMIRRTGRSWPSIHAKNGRRQQPPPWASSFALPQCLELPKVKWLKGLALPVPMGDSPHFRKPRRPHSAFCQVTAGPPLRRVGIQSIDARSIT